MTSFGNAPRQFTGHHDGSAAAAAGAGVCRAYPDVIFKDGPCGRRAALAYGPDVWEVIKFLREVDERGPAAVDAAAEVFAVDTSRIGTAISYYGDYASGEIDAEIADADEASVCAESGVARPAAPHRT